MRTEVITKSLEETADFARQFLASVVPGEGAVVIALSGDLGAGKTAFAKEFGGILGLPKDDMTSPTFVIEKIYPIRHKDFAHLIHIDAYRLESEGELEKLGWSEIVSDSKNLIVVEWPEMIPNLIPKTAHRITFEFIDEESRRITINGKNS
jgi:tRNA threonylcarbamoyladenosine biosynthesis protein TsaE